MSSVLYAEKAGANLTQHMIIFHLHTNLGVELYVDESKTLEKPSKVR